MAHTNVFMNWTGVTVTPSGGSLIPITGVVDVQVIDADGLEMWQADGHKYPTVCVAATGAQGLTLIGADVGAFAGIPRNTPCTVVAILNDARNQTGSGAITHTLVNAVVAEVPRSGQTNKFAGTSISFMGYSSDGTTPPLTYAQAT